MRGAAPGGLLVGVVLPARDEERALPAVLPAIPPWVAEVVVVDNGSRDGTAAVARAHGATVVAEPVAGYGRACLAGIAALSPAVGVIMFLDADASDDPGGIAALLAPIAAGRAEFVLGSRTQGGAEPGALTPQQRFGNALACTLMRFVWGARYSDLGPFRAITRAGLARLSMQDRTWGWTVEMQIRAAKAGLRTEEVALPYRRRIGVSKISGTVMGTLRAGTKILWVIGREALRRGPP
jgi:glycosyltransferase involved in cell wall biosynthesis